jgi:hypothetical protein
MKTVDVMNCRTVSPAENGFDRLMTGWFQSGSKPSKTALCQASVVKSLREAACAFPGNGIYRQ